jgi:hypothetical protein
MKMENLKNEEFISLRGELVKTITLHFCEKALFTTFNDVEERLQNELDEHLKFETKISDLKQKENLSFGNISFNDENGVVKVVGFTIIIANVLEKFN